MPFGDRTGPGGFGSRTGRGLGYCTGFENPGFVRGPGMGMGPGILDQELEVLKAQSQMISQQLMQRRQKN